MARQFRAAALKGGISKRVSPNLLRHRFAARLLESGADIGTIQDLMGHASLASTIIYLFGVQRPSDGAPAPIDCAFSKP